MTTLRYSEKKIVGALLVSRSLLETSMILVFTIASITAIDLAGGNKQWTGVPSTVGIIASAAVAYPVGRLMDRAGRRIGLILGHLVGLVGGVAAAWAVVEGSLLLFLGAIFVMGAGRGAVELGRYAAADASPPSRRARAISLVVLGGTVGSILGPILLKQSEQLAPLFSLPVAAAPWALSAVLAAVGALLLAALLHPDPRDIGRHFSSLEPEKPAALTIGRSVRTIFRDPQAQLAAGAMIFSQLSMVIVMTITPQHMDDHQHAREAIVWVITGHTLGMFAFSLVSGWLADRVGAARVIFIGGVLSTLACLTAPFSSTVLWLGITLFLLGLGWNFSFVAGSALLAQALRPSEKASVQGLVEGVVKVASGAGSLSSGLAFSALSFATTSWLTVLAAIVPALLVVLLASRQAQQPLPETASD